MSGGELELRWILKGRRLASQYSESRRPNGEIAQGCGARRFSQNEIAEGLGGNARASRQASNDALHLERSQLAGNMYFSGASPIPFANRVFDLGAQ
jgi:hypothetical protein